MIRKIIPFVAAFGLSLGASTGYVMLRAPRAAAAAPGVARKDLAVRGADSARGTAKPRTSDSATAATRAGAVPADSAKATPQRADSTAKHTPAAGRNESTPAAAGTPPRQVAAAPKPAPSSSGSSAPQAVERPSQHAAPPGRAARSSERGTVPPTDTAVQRRIAKIFGAMDPKEAARVLSHMEDDDVRIILSKLSNRQQAAILALFPAERAAAITKESLRGAGAAP